MANSGNTGLSKPSGWSAIAQKWSVVFQQLSAPAVVVSIQADRAPTCRKHPIWRSICCLFKLTSLSERRDICSKLFRQLVSQSHILHSPEQRDDLLTGRLRSRNKYPTVRARTNRFKNSYVGCGYYRTLIWNPMLVFARSWIDLNPLKVIETGGGIPFSRHQGGLIQEVPLSVFSSFLNTVTTATFSYHFYTGYSFTISSEWFSAVEPISWQSQ